MFAAKTICDTHTHTHTHTHTPLLSPTLCSLLYTRGRVKSQSYSRASLQSGRHKSPYMPAPETPRPNGVSHQLGREGKHWWNLDCSVLEKRQRDTKKHRQTERLGNLVSAKPSQLAPLMGRVAPIPKQSDVGFNFWAMIWEAAILDIFRLLEPDQQCSKTLGNWNVIGYNDTLGSTKTRHLQFSVCDVSAVVFCFRWRFHPVRPTTWQSPLVVAGNVK